MLCPEVVAVGCPSTDVLRSEAGARQAMGGAAYITALAARVAGARVGLVARVPAQLPVAVARAFGPGGLDRLGLPIYQRNPFLRFNRISLRLDCSLDSSLDCSLDSNSLVCSGLSCFSSLIL